MLTLSDKKWLCKFGYCIVKSVIFCLTSAYPNNHWVYIKEEFDSLEKQ